MTQAVSFGRFELIADKRVLYKDGCPVDLGARAFDVLSVLVDRRGRVVTKEELLDLVWTGRVVEENNLQVQISTLRKVLGPRAITTIPGRGYCFVLASREGESSGAAPETPRRHNLPVRLTPLIGRDGDLAVLTLTLQGTRMLTLTGVGGVGKTRLALELGASCLERFVDGVWLVQLAPLTDARQVSRAVATVFAIREQRTSPLEALIDAIASSELLLLIDNCEHVIDDAARVCHEILTRCERVRIVATSREALRIPGESQYRVVPLDVPPANSSHDVDSVYCYSAMHLFTERARSADPQFAIDEVSVPLAAEICRQLDGIPLAIELAAARLRSMSVDEVHARLERRLDLLSEGWRIADPRQQTLRALIDWSHELLADGEQAVFRRLSAFAGHWSLRAAEAVCTDGQVTRENVVRAISGLVEKNLLIASGQGSETPYSMLETLREYAAERLSDAGEEAATHGRHLAHFVALAEEAEPMLHGSSQQSWLERLEADHDNFRVALKRATESTDIHVNGLRLAGALGDFWWMRGYLAEGHRWLSALLAAAPDAPPAVRAKALHACAAIANGQSDRAAAWSYHQDALAASRTTGDPRAIAYGLLGTAYWIILNDPERRAAAREQFDECLVLCRDLSDSYGVAMSLNGLALVALASGPDLATAQRRHLEALEVFLSSGDRHGAGFAITGLGYDALLQGDRASAHRRYLEGLKLAREIGDRRGIAESLDGLSGVAAIDGALDRAARLWGLARRVREEFDCPMAPPMRADYQQRLAAVRAQLGDDGFDHAWREGRTMNLDSALDYAERGADSGIPGRTTT